MADILSLVDARKAINAPATDTTNDADLLATYIPAVTPIVEDIVGPVIVAGGRTYTADGGRIVMDGGGRFGGRYSIVLPSPVVSVESVTENGTALVAGSGYVVNARSGILYRGSSLYPFPFYPGTQNVVVTYTAGPYADQASVAPFIKLGARIILAQLWAVDNTAFRPSFAGSEEDMVSTPSGFAIPRRAHEVLTPAMLGPSVV